MESLSTIADYADLLAALGVIGSLVFVAFELRKSSEQARLNNWNAVLSGLHEHKRRTDNPVVAELVVKGRSDFAALTDAEKLAFSNWMDELVQSYEGFLVHQSSMTISAVESRKAAIGALAMHFAFPGCVEWYEWSGARKRWPGHLIEAIEEGIAASSSNANG